MSFVKYDLIFMSVFILVAVIFLYYRRHKLKRKGWIFLYHTQRGLSFMDSIAKNFSRVLKPMQYLVVAVGYFLMFAGIWLIVSITYQYIRVKEIAETIKAPPIAPLIPYFPQLFGIQNYFPPFYFTYFLVSLAIVAVVHEFAHRIFMRLNNIKIKSTGFAFFGPFFGAFVEQDDKQMNRAKKFPQLSVLAAGTFANVVMTILFTLLLWAFFVASFVPAGVQFNAYAFNQIELEKIDSVNGFFVQDVSQIGGLLGEENLTKLTAEGKTYYTPPTSLKKELDSESEKIIVFEDAPAINAKLEGAISEIDGMPIRSQEKLREELAKKNPGDFVEIKTIQEDREVIYDIQLAEREGNAYLGIMTMPVQRTGFGLVYSWITKVKDPNVYYVPAYDGDFAWFVYYLLWWIVIINLLVALFNMLPLGILDGGRFFYLTIWGITGSEKIGRRAFSIATWFIVLLFVLMTIRWVFAVF